MSDINLRTPTQNKALHLYFELLAHELNEQGLELSKMIRADIPWTKNRVKEMLWKDVQEEFLGKKSTTELTTREVNEVYDIINRAVSEQGVTLYFPSHIDLLTETNE